MSDLSQLSPVRREAFKSALSLWDGCTEDLDRLYGFLMEGKSELAAVMLQSYKALHNTQSRTFLYAQLEALALGDKEVKG